ncbi:hypothetical protein [Pseudomonas sp. FSL W7-0098]|uniref:hypothetical protein n=1 Tax=Pseudomonas sp. FSL W7-0098 TaxID=2496120 RepID=UPI00110CADCB|nr:hypothetical protein [Pseudomonas sp. FSL W7-0098]
MITLKHGDTTIKMPAASLAKLAVASVFAQVLPPAANVQPIYPHSVPELGAAWPGQGGFNGGLVAARDDVPAHYLIVASKDAGSHEWGGRGIEVKGLSKTDGYTNAQVLIGNEDETKYPASNACAEYQADGVTGNTLTDQELKGEARQYRWCRAFFWGMVLGVVHTGRQWPSLVE